MNYREYNDYELLHYANEKNEEAIKILYEKYEPLISSTAKKLNTYLNGSGLEKSDLMQEGRLGFMNAIEMYDEKKDTLFYTYAKACIEKRMFSLITASRRQKHRILNESLSLEGEDDMLSLADVLFNEEDNPEQQLLRVETVNELILKMHSRLTAMESQVFELKLNGFQYREIAEILERTPKAVDNALQRIRIKLKQLLENESE